MIATPVFPDLAALVADESLYMRRILRDMLTRVGIKRVFEAPDGAEALGVLSESKPDLAIIDWDLAILSGEEFIRLTRTPKTSPAPTVPIILMLSKPRRYAVDRAVALGVNEVIGKPFSPEDPVVTPRRGAQPSARLRRGERALAAGAARGRGGREGGGLTRSFALWAWQRRRAVALFVPTRAPASCRAGASGFDRVGQGRSGCPAGFAGARRRDERAWRSALGAAGPAQRPAALAARASPPGRAAERLFLRGARSRHQQLPPSRRRARPLRLSGHGRLLAHRAARRGL